MVMECLRGVPCDRLLSTQPAPSETLKNHASLDETGFLEVDGEGQSSGWTDQKKGMERWMQEQRWPGLALESSTSKKRNLFSSPKDISFMYSIKHPSHSVHIPPSTRH